jgi:hypothetical protein
MSKKKLRDVTSDIVCAHTQTLAFWMQASPLCDTLGWIQAEEMCLNIPAQHLYDLRN